MGESGTKRGQRFAHGLLALVCLLGVAHLAVLFKYTMDDAYITFRYSSNLADGAGLVHNPGQYVKGFSNTTWVLLMAVPELLGYSPLQFSKMLGFASFVMVAALLYRRSKESFSESTDDKLRVTVPAKKKGGSRKSRRRPAGHATSTDGPRVQTSNLARWHLFPLLVLGISAPVAVWFVSGMEMGFYCAIVFLAVSLRLHEQRNTPRFPTSVIFFMIAIWSRPEGIIFFVAMAFHDIVYRIVRRRFSAADLLWFLLPLSAYALELVCSWAYFGDPFPNTFYAKVPSSSASTLFRLKIGAFARQLFLLRGDFGSYLHLWGGSGIVAVGILGLLRRPRFRHNSAYFLMVAAQAAFVTRTGHDWWPACRFLVPVIPFLILLLNESLFFLSSFVKLPYRNYVSAVLMAAAVALMVPGNRKMSLRVFEERAGTVSARRYIKQGEFFDSLTEAGRSLTAFDIGGIGYASRLEIIDTAGLTNHFIAMCRRTIRKPLCVRYLLLLQPDIIRRHPGSQLPDQWLYREALASRYYLPFSGGKILLLRQLVLTDEIPDDARPVEYGEPDVGPHVVAVQFPSVSLPGKEMDGKLYWERPKNHDGTLVSRRILVESANGFLRSVRSPSVGDHVGQAAVWREETYFADYLRLTAPEDPGEYYVTAVPEGSQRGQRVASFTVIPHAAVDEYARQLLEQVESLAAQNRLLEALRISRDAARLGHRDCRDRYVDLAVGYAELCEQRAAALQPRYAMARLNDARFTLYRAFYDLGHATTALRRGIDHIEATREAVVQAAFVHDIG